MAGQVIHVLKKSGTRERGVFAGVRVGEYFLYGDVLFLKTGLNQVVSPKTGVVRLMSDYHQIERVKSVQIEYEAEW
jgi:hypothetical protein